MKPFKKWAVAYALVVLFIASPLLSMLAGYGLALVVGCDTNNINEGAAPDCPGGEAIYMLLVAGWLALVTIPLGALALVVLGLANLVWYLRKRRSAVSPPPTPAD